MNKIAQFTSILLILLLLASCSPSTPQVPEGWGQTAAAYTMVAVLTQSSFQTVEAKLTEVSRPSETPSPGEITPNTTGTIVPLTTALPTAPPPTLPPASKAAGTKCNQIGTVTDVTYPDRTPVKSGEKFVKVWRVKNAGTCTWTKVYDLIPAGGTSMTDLKEIPLTKDVKPGETIDLSVSLEAPGKNGVYTSYWELQDNQGKAFGLGPTATQTFWVQVNVGGGIVSGNSRITLDLASSYCNASWFSTAGVLNCPSAINPSKGSVSMQTSVTMENGAQRNENTIIMVPSSHGKISGQFPAIQVAAGDKFNAIIGCLNEHPKCDIQFQLGYHTSDGQNGSLGSWGHTLDGYSDELNIDLSNLGGNMVEFILTVTANNDSTDNIGYRVSPRVWH